MSRALTALACGAGALLLVVVGTAQAQVQPPPFPTAPSGVVDAAPRDAGFANWRGARLTSGERRPRLLASRSASLVVSNNVERYLPDLTANLLRAVGRCRDVLGLADQVIESSSARRPWAPFDAAMRAPALTFTLQAEPGAPVPDCITEVVDRIALSEAAISLDGGLPSLPALSSAVLRVDGRVVQPLQVGRVAVRTLSVAQAEGVPQWQLRLYVGLDDIVPRADGSWPTVALEVYRDDGSLEAVAISTSAIAAVLWDAAPWRMARAIPASGARWASHRNPADPTLRRAIAARGDEAGGTTMSALLDTVRAGAIRPSRDQVPSHIVLGEWLAAAGDTAGARLVATDLRGDARCLRISPESGSPLAPFLATVPDTRACQFTSQRRALINSVALPGLGQTLQRHSLPRRIIGVALFAGSAFQFNAALEKQAEARDAYDFYRAATNQAAADQRFLVAEQLRLDAKPLAMTGVYIWAFAAAENYWYESRRRKRLDWLTDYGRPPTLRVGVVPTPSGALGFGVSITH